MGNMVDQNTIEFKPVNNLEVSHVVSNPEIPQTVNTDLSSEESLIAVPSVDPNLQKKEQQVEQVQNISPNTPAISVGYPVSQNGTEPSSIVLAKASGEILSTAV